MVVAEPGDSGLAKGEQLLLIAERAVISQPCAEGLFVSLPWTPGVTIPVRVRGVDGTVRDAHVPAARRQIPGKPYHGLTVAAAEDTLVIESVDSNSPAQRAELHEGDVLLEANGKALKRKLDFLKAMVKLEVGDQFELKAKGKDGEVRVVKVVLMRRD